MTVMTMPAIEQTTEAAGVEAEVPAVEISRDDRADTERPERPEGGVTAQLAPFEIAVFRVPIGDRSDCPLVIRHGALLGCLAQVVRQLGQ